ncbi:HupE/UreJ family protein [Eleftheria terrae]|uniref:HupE/UreJ family protein n=1 Tax=Eleftheria terrae TaxID=1597781 RepID=UPI00263B0F1C|nr:HupE/UreJ family protein [Eleftheria terrae]WKB55593.1 HupE/UreJ family protein [Eleftheria terrae]
MDRLLLLPSPRTRAPHRAWTGAAVRGGAAAFAVLASPAFAHHAMGGAMPGTFGEGLLSGLAHPVIGLDHLAFVLALALLVARLPLALRAGLAGVFVAGSLAGTVLHLNAVTLPAGELLVGLSVVVAGLALLWRRALPAAVLWTALPVAGLLHGYAYGESIVGAESTPLLAYLFGFALIQAGLVVAVSTVASRWTVPQLQRAGLVAGTVVGVLGAYFSFVQLAPLAA